jgi:hypothetical protein
MKLRIFLLVTAALTVGMNTAHASCVDNFVAFPQPHSGKIVIIQSGFCITDPNSGARLRWDNANSHELQLFDTDGGGNLLWCAHDSSGHCAQGASFCLQQDGNMVIYDEASCQGHPLWASNTVGENDDGEGLFVVDTKSGKTDTGERAAILNDLLPGSDTGTKVVWLSNNTDTN